MLAQFGVTNLAGDDNGIHQISQERMVDAQHTAMAGSAAQQAAHNITAAFVGGQDAVRSHEHGSADMVGDDADGDIVLLICTVLFAGDALHMVQNSGNGINFKQVIHILHDNGQTLQAHAGINVRFGQQRIGALAIGIILAEHQVPDFHEAVAVTANAAGRLAAAILQAAVKVDLTAGAARTRAMLPEVILFAQADHVVFGDADRLGPDIIGLVIVLIDRDIQAVSGDFQLFGQELPSPGNDLFLEIILEAEVAQHFKEAAMACGNADALNIRGTDALLAGGNTVAGRFFLAKEPLFHRCHTAVDKQQAGVIFGHQREAAKAQMAFAFKIVQVFFA